MLGLLNPFQKTDTDYYLMVPESFAEDKTNDIRYITFTVKEELPEELDIYELNDIFSDTDRFLTSNLSFYLDDDVWKEMGENRQLNLFVTKEQYDMISYLYEEDYPLFIKTSTLVKVEDFKTLDAKGNFYTPESLMEAKEIVNLTDSFAKNNIYYFYKVKEDKEGNLLLTVENIHGQKRSFILLNPSPIDKKNMYSYRKEDEIHITSYDLDTNSYILSFDNAAG